jgi:hypothetical protein
VNSVIPLISRSPRTREFSTGGVSKILDLYARLLYPSAGMSSCALYYDQGASNILLSGKKAISGAKELGMSWTLTAMARVVCRLMLLSNGSRRRAPHGICTCQMKALHFFQSPGVSFDAGSACCSARKLDVMAVEKDVGVSATRLAACELTFHGSWA